MRMKTRHQPNAATPARTRREAESFGVQLGAAISYAVVVVAVLVSVVGSFSDDLGLGQAEVLAGPITLLSLWAIKRRSRSRGAAQRVETVGTDMAQPPARSRR
jgi:hypothetical protein